jgi:bifunctional enzyme CysN/CysC
MHDATGESPLSGGRNLLRLLACGSVDDGKSTLIGRMLYDTEALLDDQMAALERDSRRYGTTGEGLDFALLLDGLEAEREQGITIDVAYRYFATPRRSFIIVDAPGHEQYTRNMATGASNAEAAVVLLDARKGVLRQSRRHTHILSLMGIRHAVLAVNKMDLIDFSRREFERIAAEYGGFAEKLGFASVAAIPISARHGDNVARPSARMPWYAGPTLLGHLESIEVDDGDPERPFRLPVQWVSRPHQDFRGYSGTVAAGRIRIGDTVAVARSGLRSRVTRLRGPGGDMREASAGDSITLLMADEVDASRGDMIAAAEHPTEVAEQFAAHVIWLGEEPMYPGRSYLLKANHKTVTASVTGIKHQIDVDQDAHLSAKSLKQNEIGLCNLAASEPLAFDSYKENRTTGSFILIDRFTNATVAAGMIEFGLRRAHNIHAQLLDVKKAARAAMMRQQPKLLWFTGLSGAGKSTIANLVERRLAALGHHTYVLDGDNVRRGLNRDLGFQASDRVENVRRVAEVAKLMLDAGLIVLVSLISPFRAERRLAREIIDPGEFVEIFVDAPIDLCRQRDPKGLYKRADAGEIKNFTGVDSPYEKPENPELILETDRHAPEQLADRVIELLRRQGAI